MFNFEHKILEMEIEFRPLQQEDLDIVRSIYDYYIENTTVTYHTEPITIEELEEFIAIGHLRYLSFGIYYQGEMIGYTYLGAYKKRQAYYRTAEITFYLKPHFTGKGVGEQIIHFMEAQCALVGLKNLLAVISADNTSSIKLVQRNGYERCAHFKNVGEKFGKLLDVVVYQKELEA